MLSKMFFNLAVFLGLFKNRKRQKSIINTSGTGYSLSNQNNEILKIEFNASEKTVGLYLERDFIVIDESKATLLKEMLNKILEESSRRESK